MLRLRVLYGVMVVMLVTVGTGAAQGPHRGGMPRSEVEVLSKDGKLSFPFDLINNHVIIPISVKGSEFQVILDTGMPMDGLMLYGSEAVENLGLEYGPVKARIGGAGSEGNFLEADVASGVTVSVDKLRIKKTTVIVAPPIPHFTSYHDGVIGASLFNNFVVEIDYDKERIHLFDPESYRPSGSATALPLTLKSMAAA